MEWMNYLISILSGLAVALPLTIKLIEYVKQSIKEKNWSKLIGLIIDIMSEAETKFTDGATKKEYVMALVKASASNINCNIDTNIISGLIDDLCDMTKIVNSMSR